MAEASSGGNEAMTNYARLGHAAQELLPDMLRELVSAMEPPERLIHDCISDVGLNRVLRPVEWQRINNIAINGYFKFDIQLLYKLVRNLNLVQSPTRGWDFPTDPMIYEMTIGDDVERIRRKRNEIIHRGSATVTDKELAEYFSVFKTVASRFECFLGKPKGFFVSRFAQLEICCMDPNTEKQFVNTIQALAEEEKEIKTEIDKVRTDVEQLKYKDDKVSKLQEENKLLAERLAKMESVVCNLPSGLSSDPIPRNMRDIFEAYIHDWKKEDGKFVITRATQYVMETLSVESCVTVIGCPGSGKSSIIHRVALSFQQKENYEIIPIVTGPSDLKQYHNMNKKQIFILDNIFGTVAVSCQQSDNWYSYLDIVDKILSMGNVKILVSCRLHVANDPLIKRLKILMSNQCNLHAEGYCLLDNERIQIAQKYLTEGEIASISDTLYTYPFFPLLCKLYSRDKYPDITDFFENPVEAFKQNIVDMKDDPNKIQFCAFTLCVLFRDSLEEGWFERDAENEKVLETICEEFGVNFRLNRKNLKQQLDALENTYVKKFDRKYSIIHDKIYDVAAVVCGQDMLKCFIDHADSSFIGDRFEIEGLNRNFDETVIMIPRMFEDLYFQRLLTDLKGDNTYSTFQNRQLQNQKYREKLISFLTENKKSVELCLRKFDECQLSYVQQLEKTTESDSSPCSSSEDDDGSSDFSSNEDPTENSHTEVVHGTYTGSSESCGLTHLQEEFRKDNPLPLLEIASQGYDDIINMLIKMGCNVNIQNNDGRSALFMASLHGNYRVIEVLLGNKANALQCDKWSRSPLYVACEEGHYETARLLIPKSDIVKCDTCFFKSPLHVACEKGFKRIVQLLLENGSDISQTNTDGYSPLYIACEYGHLDLVKLLLRYKADPNQCDERDNTPFSIACRYGHSEIVKELLQNRANPSICNSDGLSPLHIACKWGNTAVVEDLLHTRLNIDETDRLYGRTPLFLACEGRNEDIVDLLVKKECDIFKCDKRKQSPLYVACKTGQERTVKLLLDLMSDYYVLSFNYTDWSPLIAACEGGFTPIVNMLLARNFFINIRNTDNQCPLHIACENGFTEIVKILLHHGCDVNRLDGNEESALFISCENGYPEIVKLLLDNGADREHTNQDGWSPFYVACYEGYKEVVDVLFQFNAETWDCNDELQSPLFMACMNGHHDVVQLLLQKKADVNQTDQRKLSPLHVACKYGHVDIVKLLIENGADLNLTTVGGKCPLDLARSSFRQSVVKLLEESSSST